ncbi:MAG: hypothetical protein ACPLXP_02665, partial [Microgenomates group bacterium]
KNQLSIINYQLSIIKSWKAEVLEKLFRDLAAKNNWHVGKFFMAIRIVLTGKPVTPPLFQSMELLGRQETLKRLRNVF